MSAYIIAEIASAHNGNSEDLIKLVHIAKECGADAVKLQIFQTNKLLSDSHSSKKVFEKIEINFTNWEKVFEKINHLKIDIIIEPYDTQSFNFSLKYLKFDAIKIPTACIDDYVLIEKVKKLGKRIYIGVGGVEWEEITTIKNLLKDADIVLICGFQNFPTLLEDSNLYHIKYLKEHFKTKVGYADHIDAENSEMTNLVPLMAVCMGAEVIEKHLNLDRSKKGFDYYSSLNPDEFKKFVKKINLVPKIIGINNGWDLSDAEVEYRKFSKKYALSKIDLKKDGVLSIEDISFKRTDDIGLSRLEIANFIGKVINQRIPAETIIKKEYFDE